MRMTVWSGSSTTRTPVGSLCCMSSVKKVILQTVDCCLILYCHIINQPCLGCTVLFFSLRYVRSFKQTKVQLQTQQNIQFPPRPIRKCLVFIEKNIRLSLNGGNAEQVTPVVTMQKGSCSALDLDNYCNVVVTITTMKYVYCHMESPRSPASCL